MLDQLVSSPITLLFALWGFVLSLNFASKTCKAIYKAFIRPEKKLRKLGQWAVITGATDGIGKAYAFALAKRGFSILLISRTESKLQAVASEIDEKGFEGVETKYVVCDYSNFDEKARANVGWALKGLDVGILINNVGVSYPFPKYFHELTTEQIANLVEMNVNSTTWMTQMVVPGMVDRKRGAIVNIGSSAGLYTMPLLAQYSASKGYVEMFSRALNAEYKRKGVTVQCQAPFYVASKLSKLRKSYTVPTPEIYVEMAMRWIGYGDPVVQPFWGHAFQGWVMECLPTATLENMIMSMHQTIRKRGMKKEAAKMAEAQKKAA